MFLRLRRSWPRLKLSLAQTNGRFKARQSEMLENRVSFPILLAPRFWLLAPLLSHMADPGRHLSGAIRPGKIILGIASRAVFTVSGNIDKGEQVQRSDDDEGEGC